LGCALCHVRVEDRLLLLLARDDDEVPLSGGPSESSSDNSVVGEGLEVPAILV